MYENGFVLFVDDFDVPSFSHPLNYFKYVWYWRLLFLEDISLLFLFKGSTLKVVKVAGQSHTPTFTVPSLVNTIS